MEIARNKDCSIMDKNLMLLSNEHPQYIENERVIITSKRWKAKTRVMLACTIIALLLFGFAAYLINSYLKKSQENQNDITETSEIDHSISFYACGNRTRPTRGCSSRSRSYGSLCASRKKRLIGGSESSNEAWPWMAELIYENKHYCGAVLISFNVLITAAHCMYHDENRLYPSDLEVRVGSKYRLSQREDAQSASISKIFIHESFKLSSLENDIAIITLVHHVKPTKSIWPICISGHEDVIEGTSAKMAGWGKTSYEGSFSPVLREATVPVVETTECRKSNEGLFKGVSVNIETNVCGGFGKFRPQYGCNGDSGGPLMVETFDEKWTLIGIMSWGGPTCSALETNSYTVFTKISQYKNWIKSILRTVNT